MAPSEKKLSKCPNVNDRLAALLAGFLKGLGQGMYNSFYALNQFGTF